MQTGNCLRVWIGWFKTDCGQGMYWGEERLQIIDDCAEGMEERMKASAIYRKAAQLLEHGACHYWGYALDCAGQPQPGGDGSPLQTAANRIFLIDRLYKSNAIDREILSLCFAAAMSDTGDLPLP